MAHKAAPLIERDYSRSRRSFALAVSFLCAALAFSGLTLLTPDKTIPGIAAAVCMTAAFLFTSRWLEFYGEEERTRRS